MSLSVEQLTSPPTRSEIAQWTLDTLQELGFQTTGWQPGRIQLTLINAFASAVQPFAQLASTFVQASFNAYASGTILGLFSASRFSNTRSPALAAQGEMLFANSGAVLVSKDPGAVVVLDGNGARFTNTAPLSVAAGASALCAVSADLRGASGNIANDSALTLETSIAGITVTNPSPGDDGAGNPLPWYNLQTGVDGELDQELRQRNATKWGLLAVTKTRTAIENLALQQTGVEKVSVDATQPRGAYTVDVYISAATATLGAADMEAAQLGFHENTFYSSDTWPVPVTNPPSEYAVKVPDTVELKPRGNVYYDGQFTAAQVQEQLGARLLAFVALTPIGGRTYGAGAANVVTLGDLLQTIEGTAGVRSASLTSPAGDLLVPPRALVVPPADWFDALGLTLVQAAG